MPDSHEDDPVLRATITSYDDAWNRHDMDAILSFHTADSVFESHTTAEVAQGHDGIRRMIARYFRVFPDLTFTIRRLYARPGLVVQEWTAHATHTRPIPTRLGLAAPTGRVLTWNGVDIMPMTMPMTLSMPVHLIVRKDAYVDSAGLQRQLEAVRQPSAEGATR